MVSKFRLGVVLMLLSGLNVVFGADAPWEDGLQKIIDLMSGTTATLFATIAVMALGYLAMVGRLEWSKAGAIIFGIVIVFGAPHVVSWFS